MTAVAAQAPRLTSTISPVREPERALPMKGDPEKGRGNTQVKLALSAPLVEVEISESRQGSIQRPSSLIRAIRASTPSASGTLRISSRPR